MHLPINRGRKLAGALLVLAILGLVANQAVRRRSVGTGVVAGSMSTIADGGEPTVNVPAPAAPVPKKELKWNSSESRFYHADKPFTGSAVENYADGKLKLTWPFREGKWHGLLEEYNQAGVKVTIKHYEEGLRHGETRYFYPEGQLMKVVHYERDIEGAIQLFNRDGTAMEKH